MTKLLPLHKAGTWQEQIPYLKPVVGGKGQQNAAVKYIKICFIKLRARLIRARVDGKL